MWAECANFWDVEKCTIEGRLRRIPYLAQREQERAGGYNPGAASTN